jgi:hypothetical protein
MRVGIREAQSSNHGPFCSGAQFSINRQSRNVQQNNVLPGFARASTLIPDISAISNVGTVAAYLVQNASSTHVHPALLAARSAVDMSMPHRNAIHHITPGPAAEAAVQNAEPYPPCNNTPGHIVEGSNLAFPSPQIVLPNFLEAFTDLVRAVNTSDHLVSHIDPKTIPNVATTKRSNTPAVDPEHPSTPIPSRAQSSHHSLLLLLRELQISHIL